MEARTLLFPGNSEQSLRKALIGPAQETYLELILGAGQCGHFELSIKAEKLLGVF